MPKSVFYQVSSLILSLLFIGGVILLAKASPVMVLSQLIRGAVGTPDQLARVLATLAPLMLCASGLIFTFTAGLYNLGVEGQIIAGAIGTTLALRIFQGVLPPPMVILLGIGAGAIGGLIWGLLAGALNVYGRINEIFAGLGLNFMAQGLALYLIFGPWQRPGVASMSGTELFDQSLWLGTWGKTEASPISLLIALLVVIGTILTLRATSFGLQLRAVGQNSRAAYLLGIPSLQRLLSAFAICGMCAGMAGSLQVLAIFHRLIPSISSNLGFLALLVVMLINFNPLLIGPVAFFFSALNIGSLQLPLSLDLESSLAGIIQGTLVLFALLGQGIGQRMTNNQ
ncbi:sugar ABC transporter permease [Leptolyngbya sp. 'hensonii']|uniref:ABC transporter permease n=1 Tax=Leptolyngbya sp. 'hensonii' TaxID=1922337 RepID=UPI00095018ED|nr:ABC transporter permease [Leptolyngbya sp. 'hensonii']OLP19529.1 sugar ABC transporter permease [Leptolyngbya sp. 'hensonii']